jgi:hypothetical protein
VGAATWVETPCHAGLISDHDLEIPKSGDVTRGLVPNSTVLVTGIVHSVFEVRTTSSCRG